MTPGGFAVAANQSQPQAAKPTPRFVPRQAPTPTPLVGVVTVPSESVHVSIRAQVDAALQGVKQGKTMAVLTVKTERGVNLAIAHRDAFTSGLLKDVEWQVVLYAGKSGWDRPVDGGVSVSFTR